MRRLARVTAISIWSSRAEPRNLHGRQRQPTRRCTTGGRHARRQGGARASLQCVASGRCSAELPHHLASTHAELLRRAMSDRSDVHMFVSLPSDEPPTYEHMFCSARTSTLHNAPGRRYRWTRASSCSRTTIRRLGGRPGGTRGVTRRADAIMSPSGYTRTARRWASRRTAAGGPAGASAAGAASARWEVVAALSTSGAIRWPSGGLQRGPFRGR